MLKYIEEMFKQPLTKEQVLEINPVSLAFLGDGIHTFFVRNNVVKFSRLNIGKQHILAIKYCKANYQSKIYDKLELTEEEKEVARRARNTKTHDAPKNSNLVDYKKATCYEAVVGYEYLVGNYERLLCLLNATFEIGDNNDN